MLTVTNMHFCIIRNFSKVGLVMFSAVRILLLISSIQCTGGEYFFNLILIHERKSYGVKMGGHAVQITDPTFSIEVFGRF